MARPKSEDKRSAILNAAVQLMAEQGESAPTSRIARLAGVAEGTLFTYFATKDELLNQLYLSLKNDLKEVMLASYPKKANVQTRARHTWESFVDWGVGNPQKHKVMALLGMSDRVTAQSKATGMQAFAEVSAMIRECIASGALRDQPPAFVSAILEALANTTMNFMMRHPAHAERYRASGFQAFWNAVSKK
jgi:AcrR family transcriptional regulator